MNLKSKKKPLRNKQILTAANILFKQKGLNSTTMDDIAMEANFSVGAIYRYFKSKDDIYTLLSLEVMIHLEKSFHHITKNNLPVESKIHAFFNALMDTYEHDTAAFINLLHLQSAEPLNKISDDILKQMKHHSASIQKDITSVIKKGITEKKFINETPAQISDFFWGIFAGTVLWTHSKTRLNPDKDFVRSTLQKALKIFIKGITME